MSQVHFEEGSGCSNQISGSVAGSYHPSLDIYFPSLIPLQSNCLRPVHVKHQVLVLVRAPNVRGYHLDGAVRRLTSNLQPSVTTYSWS